MQLKISLNNSKIGKIPNLSLPPGVSCAPGVPCFNEGCYAKGPYNRYPATKAAWDSNYKLFIENSAKFFAEWDEWLTKHKPKRFRIFVGGDFPSESFYFMTEGLAIEHPKTSFLAFTKRYDYDYSRRPENLQIVLSTWPGWPLPTNTSLPWAWLSEDFRRRKSAPHYACPGGCGDCPFFCWDKLDKDTHVVFPRH